MKLTLLLKLFLVPVLVIGAIISVFLCHWGRTGIGIKINSPGKQEKWISD